MGWHDSDKIKNEYIEKDTYYILKITGCKHECLCEISKDKLDLAKEYKWRTNYDSRRNSTKIIAVQPTKCKEKLLVRHIFQLNPEDRVSYIDKNNLNFKNDNIKILSNGNAKVVSNIKNEYILNENFDYYELKISGSNVLTKNGTILFDKEDYDKIKKYKWYINPKGYAFAEEGTILMHLYVLGINQINLKENDPLYRTDHKNRNKLDNRKENLEKTNALGNANNQSLRKDNTTGIAGVKRYNAKKYGDNDKRYQATITHNGKREYSPVFKGKNAFENACKWREEKAKLYGNKNGK